LLGPDSTPTPSRARERESGDAAWKRDSPGSTPMRASTGRGVRNSNAAFVPQRKVVAANTKPTMTVTSFAPHPPPRPREDSAGKQAVEADAAQPAAPSPLPSVPVQARRASKPPNESGSVAVCQLELSGGAERLLPGLKGMRGGLTAQQQVAKKKREIFGRNSAEVDTFWEEEVVEEKVLPVEQQPPKNVGRRSSVANRDPERKGSSATRQQFWESAHRPDSGSVRGPRRVGILREER